MNRQPMNHSCVEYQIQSDTAEAIVIEAEDSPVIDGHARQSQVEPLLDILRLAVP